MTGQSSTLKPVITRREWLWALGWAAFILLLTSLPYLYGAALSTPDNQFGGFVIGVEDGYSYLGKMRLGAEGGWQFHLFYTSEPHQSAWLFLFHLLLGKLARLTGLSLIGMYHLVRLFFGLLLLLTVYYFAAFFTPQRSVRRLTFWLVAMGSGLGWLAALLGWTDWLGLPLDFYSPEAFAFHLLFGLPHLSLGLTLFLWAILGQVWAWQSGQWHYAFLSGLALLAMSFVGVFYIVSAGAALAAGWLAYVWRGETRRWRNAGMVVTALLMPLPVLFYNGYVFLTNPVFKEWAAQNLILSPSPAQYGLAFGLWLIPAAYAVPQIWRGQNPRGLMLTGWVLTLPVLVYLPFNLQRRLMMGGQIPLAILAAGGVWRWANGSPRRWQLGAVGLAGLLSLSNLMMLAGAGVTVAQRQPPVFQAGAVVSAADWLAKVASADEVVLAAYSTGNFLPTRMPARVFVGHGSETVHSIEKQAMIRRFFQDDGSTFHQQFLDEYNVDYLFYGPAERELDGFAPETAPWLQQIYDNGPVQIYRVD
jgi:hypothetical protein